MSTAILAQLRDALHAYTHRNLFLAGTLRTLLRLLEAHHIPAIPYKGPVLAALAYGDLALRQFSDLDMLVHPRDFHRAQELFSAQGYRRVQTYGWEVSWVDKHMRVCVDLHQGITPWYFPCPFDFAPVWERRQPLALAGTTVSTLSSEDTLLLLCVQVAKDGWDRRIRLAKICDIAAMLCAHQPLDWERVMQEARRWRSQRMFAFGLHLARELLGTALPQDMVSWLASHPSVDTLVTRIRKRLCRKVSHSYPVLRTLSRFRFHFAVRECLRDKLFPTFLFDFLQSLRENGRGIGNTKPLFAPPPRPRAPQCPPPCPRRLRCTQRAAAAARAARSKA
jgi:hypothetical protein